MTALDKDLSGLRRFMGWSMVAGQARVNLLGWSAVAYPGIITSFSGHTAHRFGYELSSWLHYTGVAASVELAAVCVLETIGLQTESRVPAWWNW